MKFAAPLTLLLAITPAWAQFGSAGAPPTMPGWSRAPVNASGAIHPYRMPRNSRELALGEAWLDIYTPQPGQPTYIVVQPQAAAAPPPEPARPVTPLMIERQGARFVRTQNLEPLLSNGSAAPETQKAETLAKREIRPTVPVTLIFRDGHQEKVESYSIVGGRIYTSADYAQTGTWLKAINLSALNVPATIETNRQSGVPFALPKSPNEVIASF